MSAVDERTDLDLDLIEQLWEEEHCEANHSFDGCNPCVHRVVAISRSTCGENLRVCGSYAEYVLSADEFSTCHGVAQWCGKPPVECWSLEWL